MLRKTYILPIVLGLVCMPTHAHIAALYPSGWHMVEDIFITQPQEETGSIPHKIARGTASLMSLWGSFALTTVLLTKAGLSQRQQDHNSIIPFKYLVSGVATYSTYKAIYNLTISHKEISALQSFIAQWPHYRKNAPHNMHQVFDDLYENHKKGLEVTNSQATGIVRLLKQGVYKQFPERYGRQVHKDFDMRTFFDFKKFEADVKIEAGNLLRGVADLYRAVTGR